MATQRSASRASDAALRRHLGFGSLFFLSIGGIVGSGWLFGVLGADSAAGPAVVFSWAIGGVLILLIALSYAEVSGMLPRSGAIVRYPHYTHGAFTGFLLGWAYLLSAVTVPAIEAEAVVQYAGAAYLKHSHLLRPQGGQTVLTGEGIALAFALMVVFFTINLFGVRWLSRVNGVVTWWKLIIPVLTFVLLFTLSFHTRNFSAYGGFTPLGVKPIFSAIATSGIVFSYLGFRQALDFAGEARDPQRDVPRATVLSVLAGMVLYILLQLAFTGAIVWGKSGVHPGDWAALKGSAFASGPFYSVMKAAGVGFLGFFASFLLADSLISPTGTGYIYLGTTTRTFYGLAIDGYLPSVFHRIARRVQIPAVSLVAALVVGCLFFLPFPGWYALVGFISSATVLTYISGGVGLPVLRRVAPDLPRPFRLPGAPVFAPLGFLAAVMVVYWSGFTVLINVVTAVFVGLPLFAWFYAVRERWMRPVPAGLLGAVFLAAWVATAVAGHWVPETGSRALGQHLAFPVYFVLMAGEVCGFTLASWWLCDRPGRTAINRSWWLIALILGELLLSYYGGFGPLPHPGISFPLDSLPALGIGLACYVAGVASGYETPEMAEITASGSGLVPVDEDVVLPALAD